VFPSQSSASVGLDGSAFSVPATPPDEFPHSSGSKIFKINVGLLPLLNPAASMQLDGNCNTVSKIHDGRKLGSSVCRI